MAYVPIRGRNTIPSSARSPSINLGQFYSPPASSSSSRFSFAPRVGEKLSSRARRLVVGCLVAFLVLVVGPSIARHSGGGGGSGGSSYRQSGPVRREAADGTPRASSFRPVDEATSKDPSVSLSHFLDSHFPSSRSPHIWLTMADVLWARTGTAALHSFVERLNVERRAAYGRRKGGVRDTKLVVLCLDDGCVEEVSRYRDADGRDAGGGYAYGGFRWNRPDQIFASTWPKLRAFIDVLPHRDLFFADSDVAFRYDPYPHIEPFMSDFDLVASENNAWDHINTGWMWLRKSQMTADAWNEVLEMDFRAASRDQNNFNKVLDTELLRHSDENGKSLSKAKPDFVTKNGLRVHVLDDNLFRAHHFTTDRPDAARDQSLHVTCGDTTRQKVYLAKAQGFWSDVEGYYSEPPPLISIDHLSGLQKDVLQLFKILLVVAHYTGRTILPPTTSTFLDVDSLFSTSTHRIHSSFPIPEISDALGVPIVEPTYPSFAVRELVGGSVLGNGSRVLRADMSEGGFWEEKEARRRQEAVARLSEIVELDMRHTPTLASLLTKLSTPPFSPSRAQIVRLIHFDWPHSQHWRDWKLPRAVEHVRTCRSLEKPMECEAICRGSKEGIMVEEGWPSRRELVGEEDGEELA
ncbi:hypothetical protein JCM8547_000582 [Rhodosporidiobolus lusitaniae]